MVFGSLSQHGGALGWAVGGACLATTVLAGLRWLRVAQREHYLPDSASRFALRWWSTSALNRVGILVAVAGLLLTARWAACGFAVAAVTAAGPRGLGVRGRTSPLRWTRRLRTLAAVWLVLQCAVVLAGVLSGFVAAFSAAGALVTPALVDLSCVITAPLERALSDRHVKRASEKLSRVGPKIVAITGSYGKTTTKGYVAHLLSSTMAGASSPASYNNKLGLARSVNEMLSDASEVFVAEMGTYGRGEIATLCSWLTPDISVITAIGPVHLERFGNEDEILEAKSEILEPARCCVLMVDDERLSSLARQMEQRGKKVWRASATARSDAQVTVAGAGSCFELSVNGNVEARALALGASVRPQNLACAIAVALELDVPVPEIVSRLSTLPVASHRLEPHKTERGFVVLDDTYNSNPAGVRVALEALSEAAEPGHRRVVVTPGMVELGARQARENRRFGEAAAAVATDLLVVGRTNRKALVAGFGPSPFEAAAPEQDGEPERCELVTVDHREQAVEWVRERLGPGDAVLYENDLPDHYP